MNKEIQLGNHIISKQSSVYIVAELSANHNMDYGRACAIIDAHEPPVRYLKAWQFPLKESLVFLSAQLF